MEPDELPLELEPVPQDSGIVWKWRDPADRPPTGALVAFALFAFLLAGGAEWLGIRRERNLLDE